MTNVFSFFSLICLAKVSIYHRYSASFDVTIVSFLYKYQSRISPIQIIIYNRNDIWSYDSNKNRNTSYSLFQKTYHDVSLELNLPILSTLFSIMVTNETIHYEMMKYFWKRFIFPSICNSIS